MNDDLTTRGDEDRFDDDSVLANENNDDASPFADEDILALEVDDLLPQPGAKPLMDRRDRLNHAQCADEPSDPEFQSLLSAIYSRLDRSKQLRMSLFQRIRTDYLIATYCESQNMFALAADHFRHGAEVAQQIPDLALYAQLKFRESRACTLSDRDFKFYRAFETARIAWDVWHKLANRDVTEDIYFEFKLTDNIGGCAVRVGEYSIAADGMERAALLLLKLRGRPDFKPEKYRNADLLLTWDWVTVSIGKGDYRDAFKRILQTRRKGRNLLNPINRVRLQWLIALIALGCAEQGPVEGYRYKRLLAVAGKAIDDAYLALQECEDERGRALMLLTEAKLLRMLKIEEGRLDKIKEAEAVAVALDDLLLRGHVDIAWGDELVFQGKKREAKTLYRKVVQEMTQIEYLDLANIASQRIVRLTKPTRTKSPKKRNDPPSNEKIILN